MRTYHHRFLASLALAGAALAIAACALLLRPPAAAAQKGQQGFLFGPVQVTKEDRLVASFFNSGPNPTPPVTVDLRDTSGEFLDELVSPSVASGRGVARVAQFDANHNVVAHLFFHDQMPNQAIPVPLAVTIQVVDGTTMAVRAVLVPAR